ncbi:MAG: hypothetical protein KBD78_03075 [Oligoflexales bacterium]|nr:hypothetical protein [Oligoflexales bacterium]
MRIQLFYFLVLVLIGIQTSACKKNNKKSGALSEGTKEFSLECSNSENTDKQCQFESSGKLLSAYPENNQVFLDGDKCNPGLWVVEIDADQRRGFIIVPANCKKPENFKIVHLP